ncbi:TetR/AcrR family transcriptional regulator [Paenarthrobacter aurescens]|uniref:HTH tetR-type domain-containing protein n=1 Tax=Paenarthrobacter aurescens TaxID=43663 RepID=A0A4Y3NGL2_PAEAU|nr:TetR family transcriptional regulator [Paenarthrobacter aurescens]UKA48001.1 TetR family transcriptional regulator [Arthrobacter sp. FW305-123]MDO6143755.1 TetR family transcriptional regulator [Paenarthrobacter aurescens]MDO6147603.1 TetR family transcriptional regulator [Paenarthrobacter aurescens]MDO6158846.1 TetR family transcriptional regulator [Paenarthrobacter aurescens]MDO6162830.1 TetR family transcriptional regulator [Paenarthrobacter aurescens]
MPDRRTELADAALAVVAAKGLKGLTHRAVDAQAGVSLGTTSNYFRNRAALMGAAVDRVEERDRLLLEEGGMDIPTSVAALAEQIAAAVLGLAKENAQLTRARFAFALDQPEVVAAGHERLVWSLAHLLEALSIPEARARAEAVSDYSDGLAMHLLTARKGQDIDTATVARNIRRLLEG